MTSPILILGGGPSGLSAAHALASVGKRVLLVDKADRLVAQHRSGLAPDVPGHDVARADSTGVGAYQEVVGPGFGPIDFLDANVSKIVKACGAPKSLQTLGRAPVLVNLRGQANRTVRRARMR